MKLFGKSSVSSRAMRFQMPRQSQLSRLARLIDMYTPRHGTFDQRIAGLTTNRYAKTDRNWIKTFHLPSVMIVAQGMKSLLLGRDIFEIGSSQMLMFPVALPVAMKVLKASPSAPFLGIGLTLDPERISKFVPKVYPRGLSSSAAQGAGFIAHADTELIKNLSRLMECLSSPEDADLLAPIVKDEILIRLLRSSVGVHIAEMGFAGSHVQHIAKAIDWLRNNYSQPVKVSELAQLAHMSVSLFHAHFKTVTAMTPLQYQKALRLQEARHLMLSQKMDAQTAGCLVGYLSPSQFSRDYRSYFGNPPGKDIAAIQKAVSAND